MADWFVYMVRCSDNSLYTGVTTDTRRRVQQHNDQIPGAAKYTRTRQPVSLVYQEFYQTRSEACRREYEIKALSKRAKEQLVLRSKH